MRRRRKGGDRDDMRESGLVFLPQGSFLFSEGLAFRNLPSNAKPSSFFFYGYRIKWGSLDAGFAIVTKPNESMRLIVTTFIGVVFGFLIGASFPTLPLAKLKCVSDNLLHDASSNQETLIFCSQTLRSKVQRDFEELPSEAFRPLRDLLNLIENISQRPPLKLEPSLAVAALAVHVPAKDWGDGGIVNWLRDEMNSHPEWIPSFLELLRVLPERIPASTLASHPLVLTALSSLNSDILSEASVNDD
ncbi:unnamed protein product [Camellia sinensis]